jgi:uncharacterized protein DUF6629
MCFSAGASFGASAVLSIIGTAAIMKARTVPQGLFAGVPIIFSIQQLAEGMLWLSLKEPGLAYLQPLFTYTFLIFALVIWPVWIPFTIHRLEKDPKRRNALSVFLFLGIGTAVGAGCAIMFYPVSFELTLHHFHYNIDIPGQAKKFRGLFTILYFVATIITTFISNISRMKWLGIVFLLSYSATLIFYGGSIVSVWCYFAALLSMVVYWIISRWEEPGSPIDKRPAFTK